MRYIQLFLAFATGFALATIIGWTIAIPQSRTAWQTNLDSDVHRPLEGALSYIEQSAQFGDLEATRAQLRLLNFHFATYRTGGPPPSMWWHHVVAAATQPTRQKMP